MRRTTAAIARADTPGICHRKNKGWIALETKDALGCCAPVSCVLHTVRLDHGHTAGSIYLRSVVAPQSVRSGQLGRDRRYSHRHRDSGLEPMEVHAVY